MTLYLANRIAFLNFSRKKDRQGQIIPPECYVTWKQQVPVVFDAAKLMIVGRASVQRKGLSLLADMEIASPLNVARALPLLRLLVPCAVFRIVDSHESTILSLAIEHILLSPKGNADAGIAALGERLMMKNAGDLH